MARKYPYEISVSHRFLAEEIAAEVFAKNRRCRMYGVEKCQAIAEEYFAENYRQTCSLGEPGSANYENPASVAERIVRARFSPFTWLLIGRMLIILIREWIKLKNKENG